jgi:hypothetical protein
MTEDYVITGYITICNLSFNFWNIAWFIQYYCIQLSSDKIKYIWTDYVLKRKFKIILNILEWFFSFATQQGQISYGGLVPCSYLQFKVILLPLAHLFINSFLIDTVIISAITIIKVSWEIHFSIRRDNEIIIKQTPFNTHP